MYKIILVTYVFAAVFVSAFAQTVSLQLPSQGLKQFKEAKNLKKNPF